MEVDDALTCHATVPLLVCTAYRLEPRKYTKFSQGDKAGPPVDPMRRKFLPSLMSHRAVPLVAYTETPPGTYRCCTFKWPQTSMATQ